MSLKKSKVLTVLALIGLLSISIEAGAAMMNSKPMGKLNINSADAKQFTMLPGIGKAKAEVILKLRAQLNGFKKLDDLLKVKGIGQKLYAKILPFLKLDGQNDISASPTTKAIN